MTELKAGDYAVVIKPKDDMHGKIVRIIDIEGSVAFTEYRGCKVAFFLRELKTKEVTE